MRFRTLTAAGTLGALLLPAAADAATKPVFRGPPPKGELKGVNGPVTDADFYPRRIAIAAGDAIKLTTVAFGDTIFVPRGEARPGLAVPGPAPITGAKDAAGADVWFNGKLPFAPNPLLLGPSGGKRIDGTKIVATGLNLSDGPAKPWRVTFPTRGTYVLRSLLHPGVKLTVLVKRRGASVPSARSDARRAARQVKASIRRAKRLLRAKAPAGNVVQAGSDDRGTATIAFLPERKTIELGESVTFRMSRSSIETHNVAFGPKAYLDRHARAYFGPVFEPFVTFRSDRPGAPLGYNGDNHGNGWFNTGLLDADDASPQPRSDSVVFTRTGTYKYYCAVHGNEMQGQITVE